MASQTPLLFYTAIGSINCLRTSVLLEELKAEYGVQYDLQLLSLSKGEQKEAWYTKINPNQKVPVLVDRSRNNFAIFESAAILLYLAQHFDTDHKFSFEALELQSEIQQWLFFAVRSTPTRHGGIQPMQGQAAHFLKVAPERIPYAINRYTDEVKRLYSVLEFRLQDRDYLVGPGRGSYSIADINAFPMVNIHHVFGNDMVEQCPNVQAWLERIATRPAVKAGLKVPPPP